MVSGFGFRVSGFGFQISGFGFRGMVSGLGFRVPGYGFGFRGSGFGVWDMVWISRDILPPRRLGSALLMPLLTTWWCVSQSHAAGLENRRPYRENRRT